MFSSLRLVQTKLSAVTRLTSISDAEADDLPMNQRNKLIRRQTTKQAVLPPSTRSQDDGKDTSWLQLCSLGPAEVPPTPAIANSMPVWILEPPPVIEEGSAGPRAAASSASDDGEPPRAGSSDASDDADDDAEVSKPCPVPLDSTKGQRCGIVLDRDGDGALWRVQPADADEPLVLPAERLHPLPEFPLDGVSLECLRAFDRAYADEGLPEGASTAEVCLNFVLPLTAPSQGSIAELLKRRGAAAPQTGAPFVARANIFVSHCWRYPFRNTLAALEAFALSQPDPEQTYFWLDLFANSQHNSPTLPQLWWQSVFMKAIANIGHTCLVLSPWSNPVPLTRAWCLWELLCTIKTGATLTCQIPQGEIATFNAALRDDFAACVRALALADARRADAFHQTDREMILSCVEATIGFTELNSTVSQHLRAWLAKEGQAELLLLAEPARATSRLQLGLTSLLIELGEYDKAEPLAHAAVEGSRAELGARHERTLAATEALAVLLMKQGKLAEATPLQREVLDARVDTLAAIDGGDGGGGGSGSGAGEGGGSGGASGSGSGGGGGEPSPLVLRRLSSRGDADAGAPCAIDGLSERDGALLAASNARDHMALLLQAQKLNEQAEPLFREALAGFRRVRGDRAPETLTCINNLAALIRNMADTTIRTSGERGYEVAAAAAFAASSKAKNADDTTAGAPKTDEQLAMLRTAVASNALFRGLADEQLARILRAMTRIEVPMGTEVITQGDKGDLFYVAERGEFEVFVAPPGEPPETGKHVHTYIAVPAEGVFPCFGELALMYAKPRAATVRCARAAGVLWGLDRANFRSARILSGRALPPSARQRLDEAGALLHESLQAKRETHGDRHPETLIGLNQLGLLHHKARKFAEAEPFLREALMGRLEVLGERHPQTLNSRGNLCDTLREMGHIDEAADALGDAVDVATATLGADHRVTLALSGKAKQLSVALEEEAAADEASLAREAADVAAEASRRASSTDVAVEVDGAPADEASSMRRKTRRNSTRGTGRPPWARSDSSKESTGRNSTGASSSGDLNPGAAAVLRMFSRKASATDGVARQRKASLTGSFSRCAHAHTHARTHARAHAGIRILTQQSAPTHQSTHHHSDAGTSTQRRRRPSVEAWQTHTAPSTLARKNSRANSAPEALVVASAPVDQPHAISAAQRPSGRRLSRCLSLSSLLSGSGTTNLSTTPTETPAETRSEIGPPPLQRSFEGTREN